MFLHYNLPDDYEGRLLTAAQMAHNLRLLLIHIGNTSTDHVAGDCLNEAARLEHLRTELTAAYLDNTRGD